jgi:hypothetical protein
MSRRTGLPTGEAAWHLFGVPDQRITTDGLLAEQALSEAKLHFPAVAQIVGFSLERSKMLYVSMEVD